MRLRTPSIQPKHSAWSTASGQVMLGLPDPFFRNQPTARGLPGDAPSTTPGTHVGFRRTWASSPPWTAIFSGGSFGGAGVWFGRSGAGSFERSDPRGGERSRDAGQSPDLTDDDIHEVPARI